MFGYVRIRKPEMKIKDYEVYQGFYCGLCHVLKEEYGFMGQVTLTYDMTFLVVLLSSVYDIPAEESAGRCIVHPGRKHKRLINEISHYAAHLNILLTYYHLKDDSEDEGSVKAMLGMRLYKWKKRRAVEGCGHKEETVCRWLRQLSQLEEQEEEDIFRLADCFGGLMAEIFAYRGDSLAEYLREFGKHLGRFIYIMDAYDDLEEDKRKGCFNPFLKQSGREDFHQWAEGMLLEEMAEAAAVYQKLPCVEYTDILGNIVYAGVWNRFDDMKAQREKATDS